MRLPYLLFLYTLSAFSQSVPQIKVLPGPKSMEDYEHQYKGCPENSECDQVMGLQITRWKELIKRIKDDKIDGPSKIKFLELFREKYGIPVEFYTNQSSQLGFKPILFDSHCKDHNIKDGKKILKGISFLKSISKEKAVAWRDQTQIEVPLGEIMIPQPVTVYEGTSTTVYQLPIGEQPLFIKNKELFVIQEEEDLFFALKIGPSGAWKIEYIDMSNLSTWDDKRSEVPCPKDKVDVTPKPFGVTYCKSIWNEDTKSSVVVKLHLGCPN